MVHKMYYAQETTNRQKKLEKKREKNNKSDNLLDAKSYISILFTLFFSKFARESNNFFLSL